MGARVTSVVNGVSSREGSGGTVTSPLRAVLSCPLPRAASEQESLEAVLDDFAPIFETVSTVDGEREGALLVVSDDAGSATTVKFWRDALSTGLAVASPAAFPWCLANAPCASIARRFGVTGPNLTWLVSFTDPRTAFDGPAAWLADRMGLKAGDVERFEAWLVALHFGAPTARAMLWHLSGGDAESSRDDPLVLAATLRDRVAADWVARTPPA
jgi:hypothetical protein